MLRYVIIILWKTIGADFLKIKDINRIPKKMTTIGGQALIEGIMMRGPKEVATAIRKPNNEILVEKKSLNTLGMKNKFFRLPFIRGVVGLIESMVLGTKTLMYSAEFYDEEEYEETKFEKYINDKFGERAADIGIFFSILLSFVLAIFLFMLVPTFLTSLFKSKIENIMLLNLVEGLIRIGIFLIYLVSVSRLDDIHRVFQYHGAEHKTIHCYENQEELTVENVKKYPILHPRCGTSFLFTVMIVSIIVLSFFGWPSPLKRLLIRLLMLPVIIGISYEFNRIVGKSNSKLAYILSYPGLGLQKMATTKEPDSEQIEVAIAALKEVIVEDEEADRWK